LTPVNDSVKDKEVTITGKVPPEPGDNTWIDTAGTGLGNAIKGTYDNDKVLKACVKPPISAPASYYYIVDIDKVGTLDPRADVR